MVERLIFFLKLPTEFLQIWKTEKNEGHTSLLINRELRISHVPPLHSFIDMPYWLPKEMMVRPVEGIAGDCLSFEVMSISYVFQERSKVVDFIRIDLEIEPVSVANITKLDKEQVEKGLPTNVPIFFDFLKRSGWK